MIGDDWFEQSAKCCQVCGFNTLIVFCRVIIINFNELVIKKIFKLKKYGHKVRRLLACELIEALSLIFGEPRVVLGDYVYCRTVLNLSSLLFSSMVFIVSCVRMIISSRILANWWFYLLVGSLYKAAPVGGFVVELLISLIT